MSESLSNNPFFESVVIRPNGIADRVVENPRTSEVSYVKSLGFGTFLFESLGSCQYRISYLVAEARTFLFQYFENGNDECHAPINTFVDRC